MPLRGGTNLECEGAFSISALRGNMLERARHAAGSLRWKSTAVGVGANLVIGVFVTVYFARVTGQLIRVQDEAHVADWTRALAATLERPLSNRDTKRVGEIVRNAKRSSALRSVVVTDQDRVVIAESHSAMISGDEIHRSVGHAWPSLLGAPIFHPATASRGPYLDVVYPIQHVTQSPEAPPRLLGYAYVAMPVDSGLQTLTHAIDWLTGIGLAVFLSAIPLGHALIRRILAPLDVLAENMSEFASGKLEVRCRVRGRNEIGRLAAAFNQMADQHQASHVGLVRLNAELEQRVAERTRQLQELAAVDDLTGLFNRRHLNEILAARFSEARRYGGDLACLMFDIDNFKEINDTSGHPEGDEMLRLAAAMVRDQLRSSDVAARFGGDEFVVLLPHADVAQATSIAERIADDFRRAAKVRCPKLRTTLSIGVADLRSLGAASSEQLIRAADAALYRAKSAGKDCVMVAVPAELTHGTVSAGR